MEPSLAIAQQPQQTTEAATLKTSSEDAASAVQNQHSNTRKRVFTFQKRWLHSLPIMEKRLSDAEFHAKRSTLEFPSNDPQTAKLIASGAHDPRDVIVCMLCEDGSSASANPMTPTARPTEVAKIWSRLNCRRGRIENHLMSKHPEFMLLLKHKRDTEGEIAVQLFLQSMREGRCNVRNEINMGLYQQQLHTGQPTHTAPLPLPMPLTTQGASPTTNGSTDMSFNASNMTTMLQATGAKRPFTPETTTPGHGSQLATHEHAQALAELESKRKKTKAATETTTITPPITTAAAMAATAAFQIDPASLLSQSTPGVANKMIVITGGDHPAIANLATVLWVLGANVLVTFRNVTAMEEFTAAYVGKLSEATTIDSISQRGIMLPMLCAFNSRKAVDEWGSHIASKLPHADVLINFVEHDGSIPSEPKPSTGRPGSASSDEDGEKDDFTSQPNVLLSLSQTMHRVFFRSNATGAIVNIAAQLHDIRASVESAAMEALTKSLATDLGASNVRANGILVELEHQNEAADTTKASTDRDLAWATSLMHTVLFLLAPSSQSINGSMLRLRPPPSKPSTAAATNGATTTEETTTSSIGV